MTKEEFCAKVHAALDQHLTLLPAGTVFEYRGLGFALTFDVDGNGLTQAAVATDESTDALSLAVNMTHALSGIAVQAIQRANEERDSAQAAEEEALLADATK